MKTAIECRREMRFWLEASKDAKIRQDKVNEEYAIRQFRASRDELLSIWEGYNKHEAEMCLCG